MIHESERLFAEFIEDDTLKTSSIKEIYNAIKDGKHVNLFLHTKPINVYNVVKKSIPNNIDIDITYGTKHRLDPDQIVLGYFDEESKSSEKFAKDLYCKGGIMYSTASYFEKHPAFHINGIKKINRVNEQNIYYAIYLDEDENKYFELSDGLILKSDD